MTSLVNWTRNEKVIGTRVALIKVVQTEWNSVSTFTFRPPPLRHDDPHPLLKLLCPAAVAVPLLSRSCWTSADHVFSAQGSSRTGRQGASDGQLCTRAARGARGGPAQQHLGYCVWWWSGHQTGQRGVSGAGFPGWYNLGAQRQVWRRSGWEYFRCQIQQSHFYGSERFYWEKSNVTVRPKPYWLDVSDNKIKFLTADILTCAGKP